MRTLASDIAKKEGERVNLKGWVGARRDHGKLIFIDLRDRSGIAQVVFAPGDAELLETADRLRPEWVVSIGGSVKMRPANMQNSEIPSGTHEVAAETLEIITEAKTPPFDISSDGKEIGEEHRLKYRYLDLRRPRMQQNLRMRAKIEKLIRDVFTANGFTEIETPYISKSTPEGARDYLVPARLHPGSFYALPQSPQQYKQLLMVAGLERYFQIVRCFRDEDTRGDRQPEFTQLDVELSFTDQEEVLRIMQDICLSVARTLYPEKNISTLDAEGNIPRMTYAEAIQQHKTDRPDIRKNKNDPDELAFLFVIDFPAFEWKESEKRWDAVHHPFTMPQASGLNDFDVQFSKDPGAMLAFQYDIVLNGYEIGGGSIRIHNPALLERVFEVMGNKKTDIREKFGHLLEAFEYGVPPHGGFAMGLDRFVAILQNEATIREVFAFPKTGDGRDLMMQSPGPVAEEQLKELHIKKSE